MAIAKLAFVFAIVAWYRGDWLHAQLRRHARVFGDALARLGVGVRGIDPARAPLEWTVEDGTDTSAHGRLARERRAILEDAKRRAGAHGGLGAGAARRMAEKLEEGWARRRSRRFAGGATRDAFPEKTLDALVAERRARAAAAAERHAEVRERVRQRKRSGTKARRRRRSDAVAARHCNPRRGGGDAREEEAALSLSSWTAGRADAARVFVRRS